MNTPLRKVYWPALRHYCAPFLISVGAITLVNDLCAHFHLLESSVGAVPAFTRYLTALLIAVFLVPRRASLTEQKQSPVAPSP